MRYSTTGGSRIENAQPLAMSYFLGDMALVHNGNLINCDELKKEQAGRGQAHYTSSDSEVLAYQVISESVKFGSIEAAIANAAGRLKGGYACLIMSQNKIVAFRDPHGLKPLVLGKKKGAVIIASESAAIKAVGGETIRDIKPGEIVVIDENGVKSSYIESGKRIAHCIFEYIYFARLDSVIDGIPVYDARMNAGRALARRSGTAADIVVGVPDSGLAAAAGYAMESGIKLVQAFHKNSYVGRSFIKPSDEERKEAVRMKLSVIESAVKGKKVILIDDSIVRGNTMRQIIEMMREAGAVSVHVRISSPPFLYPCYYGTDVPSAGQLIASKHSTEQVCESIGADTLEYLAIDDFKLMVGDLPICAACFDNDYPVM